MSAAVGDGCGIAGVTMTLGGDGAGTETTGADGSYSFTGLGNGTFTVTPSGGGRNFSDVSAVIEVNGTNPIANFEATADSYGGYGGYGGISGKVTLTQPVCVGPAGAEKNCVTAEPNKSVFGTVLAGVTITLAGNGSGTTITDGYGGYSFSNLPDGTYTVTPSKTGYTFSPTNTTPAITDSSSSTGNNFTATAVTFAQGDLTGTWRVSNLQNPLNSKWQRASITVDATGLLTFSECLDSAGSTSCPASTIRWTIDANGVITETSDASGIVIAGKDAYVPPLTDAHMTMTLNKNFIAGTSTSGSSGYQLRIAQKVTGAVYSNADLRGKSFVYHGMSVGTGNGWGHGTGEVTTAGIVNVIGTESSGGSAMTLPDGLAISVNSAGVVAISGVPSFQGFLSDDRKTIVGTFTTGTSYQLIIIQIIGQTYATNDRGGYWASHMLNATSATPPELIPHVAFALSGHDFWAHWTTKVDSGGNVIFADWVATAESAPITTGWILSLGTSGIITRTDINTLWNTFHGQLSYDKMFTVGTVTTGSGYGLFVMTRNRYNPS